MMNQNALNPYLQKYASQKLGFFGEGFHALSFLGESIVYEPKVFHPEQDKMNIQQDWQNVGEDFAKAMKQYDQK